MSQRSELEEQNYNLYAKKQAIWRAAFSSEVNQRWGNLNFKGLNSNINEMSYYIALSAFINDGNANVERRREMLFRFLESIGFEGMLPTSSIVRNYAGLPTSNLYCKRVIKNLCTNYIQSPERKFINAKTNNPITNKNELENINNLIDTSSFNYKMLDLHRKAKFCGQALAHPRIRRGQLQIQVLTPDEYQVISDSYGNMTELYIPFYTITETPTEERKTELQYHYWNNKVYRVLDKTGEPIKFNQTLLKYDKLAGDYKTPTILELNEYEHGYGRIPYEILTFDINDGDGFSGEQDLWELVHAQLICNALDFMAMENVAYSAIALWVFVNFNLGNNIHLAPGRTVSADNVKTPDIGELIPPSADTVSPNTYFDSINDLKEKIMIQAMKNLGLPNSLIQENPGLASGEAMKVDYRELEMIRLEDLVLLKPFEKRLLSCLIDVGRYDKASPVLGMFNSEIDYQINYPELYSTEKTKEEIETIIMKWELGLISPLELLTAINKNDNVSDDNEAIEIMKKNREFYKQLKGDTDEQTINGAAEARTPDGVNKRGEPQDESAKTEQDDSAKTEGIGK